MMITFFVIALLWILSTGFMTTVSLSGDEGSNASGARAIANFLRGTMPFERLQSEIVGFGWFTPGVSLSLAPLYLVDPTPSLPAIRIYASLLILALWGWTVWEVYRAFGRTYVWMLLVFPTLDITWRLFATTIWGDLPAGLLLTIVAVRAYRIGCDLAHGRPAVIRDVVGLQIVLALAFYMRGNLIAVAAAVNVFLLALPVVTGHWRRMMRHGAVVALGISIFAASIAPWSIMASRQLGGLVVSTSTPALSFGVTFGNAELCFARCPGQRGIWIESVYFSRLYGKLAGISELEAQRRMAAYATRNLTVQSYLRRVRANMNNFLVSPANFVSARFLPRSTLQLSPQVIAVGEVVSLYWTSLLYFPGLLALALANLAVVRGRHAQVESLLLKLMTLCLFVQPFVHVSHSRYWPAFGPLMALSAAFVLRRAMKQPADQNSTGLWVIQVLYVIAVALVCGILALSKFNLI